MIVGGSAGAPLDLADAQARDDLTHGSRNSDERLSWTRKDSELRPPEEVLPDVRDGLTREERVVLYVLHETQKERGGRNVPTAMLWGRVCEHFYISPEDLSAMLARLGARK